MQGHRVRKHPNSEVRFKAKSEAQIKASNLARRSANIQPISPKLRNCLKCEREFESYGANNRMCNSCGAQSMGNENSPHKAYF